MITPHLAIVDRIGGTLLVDSSLASSFVFSTNEHGAESVRATFAMSPVEAARIFDRIGTPHAVVSADGGVLWAGRVEDVGITDEGLSVTAYGYWRALSDVPYTALWSDTRMENWRVITSNIMSNRTPERYVINLDTQIYISLTKGAVFSNNADVGEVAYYIQSGSSRGIVAFNFVYSMLLPAGWMFRIDLYTNGLYVSSPLTVAATGVVQTATQTLTFTACHEVHVLIFNSTGGNYTVAAETGAFYLGVGSASFRIKTTTSSTVSGDLIAADLAANTTGLSTSTALIQSTGVDLRDELFEDANAADALTQLALFGDTSLQRFEVGVDNDRRIYFRPRGQQAREWFVNVASLDLERSLNDFYSSAYAVYKDAAGRSVRSGNATNTQAADKYGTRRAAVNVQTTNATQAEAYRDVFLADNAAFVPKAGIVVNEVYARGNVPWPGCFVRAGDYVTIRNLPVAPGDSTLTKIRRFRITRTEYDCVTGQLTIEPEQPLSSLDFLVARNSLGIRFGG